MHIDASRDGARYRIKSVIENRFSLYYTTTHFLSLSLSVSLLFFFLFSYRSIGHVKMAIANLPTFESFLFLPSFISALYKRAEYTRILFGPISFICPHCFYMQRCSWLFLDWKRLFSHCSLLPRVLRNTPTFSMIHSR